MKLHELPEIMTRKDIADVLSIGRDRSYQLVKNGEIKVLKFGSVIRVRKEDFLEYLKNATKKGDE